MSLRVPFSALVFVLHGTDCNLSFRSSPKSLSLAQTVLLSCIPVCPPAYRTSPCGQPRDPTNSTVPRSNHCLLPSSVAPKPKNTGAPLTSQPETTQLLRSPFPQESVPHSCQLWPLPPPRPLLLSSPTTTSLVLIFISYFLTERLPASPPIYFILTAARRHIADHIIPLTKAFLFLPTDFMVKSKLPAYPNSAHLSSSSIPLHTPMCMRMRTSPFPPTQTVPSYAPGSLHMLVLLFGTAPYHLQPHRYFFLVNHSLAFKILMESLP